MPGNVIYLKLMTLLIRPGVRVSDSNSARARLDRTMPVTVIAYRDSLLCRLQPAAEALIVKPLNDQQACAMTNDSFQLGTMRKPATRGVILIACSRRDLSSKYVRYVQCLSVTFVQRQASYLSLFLSRSKSASYTFYAAQFEN